MDLKSYLTLYELLNCDTSTREVRRAFGLSYAMLKDKPIEQLLVWSDENRYKLKKPLLSENFSVYLYGVTLTLVIVAFVSGLLSGIALLSYSGHEPVNVVYFMATAVFFPLFTMILTLFAMLKAKSTQSILVHISPAFWMEKILGFLPRKIEENIQILQMNPLLANSIIIKRSQFIALFFSLGLLLALLLLVVTKDIAFAWSTTLSITPEQFHRFLHIVAFPWREYYPSAVPSVELIEQSQYFRLGDKLSEEMISHASKLGEWWKFLALATIFYAILLRFGLYVFSLFAVKRAIKKSCLTLDGVEKLLSEMNEPVISTHAVKEEEPFIQEEINDKQVIDNLENAYDMVLGWAIPKDQLVVMSDAMQIISSEFCEVGGTKTLQEESEIITKSHGKVLLYVKAWEPPIMDFIDFVEDLIIAVDQIVVYPVGMRQEEYKTKPKEVGVWARKLSTLDDKKVRLKR